jgi:chemotaxis protein methyltransferase CheR
MAPAKPPAVSDRQCVAFLQWALPRLGLRWPGYRRVRRQVCKRLRARLAALGLADADAYRALLAAHPGEWRELAYLCRVTISRFYRDRGVFGDLQRRVLPALAERATAAGRDTLWAWSIGCASGEEAYSLLLAWRLDGAPANGPSLRVLGTDIDPALIRRARRACYPESSLRELPAAWRRAAFRDRHGAACLLPRFRAGAQFRRQDIGRAMPDGPFDLVLCRNLVVTYFQPPRQRQVLMGVRDRLRPDGALVLGAHEAPPPGMAGLTPWPEAVAVWRKVSR